MLPIGMVAFVATSPGQTFGVSIFNESIRLELGLSRGALAAAYTLGTLAAAVPLSYVGVLMDRHGLRKTMTGVAVLFGLACLFISQVGGWLSLILGFMALRLLGPGALAMLRQQHIGLLVPPPTGLCRRDPQCGYGVRDDRDPAGQSLATQ